MQEYKLKIKDIPIEERPRERLIRIGSKSLSNAELLAIILKIGNKKENVLELSKRLIREHNLKRLSRIGVNNLKNVFGIGEAKACQIIACFELGRRTACIKDKRGERINFSKDIAKMLIPELYGLKKEYLICVFLDSRRNVLKYETISIGSLNSSIIHPREIFRAAIEESSAAIILVHNHPSGNPNPSNDDIEITKQIIEAGIIIGIDVLDHIIIGNNNYFSLKEKGFLEENNL